MSLSDRIRPDCEAAPWVIKEVKQLETELTAFKKNNEELIHRHNAAIASWDEEREIYNKNRDKYLTGDYSDVIMQ